MVEEVIEPAHKCAETAEEAPKLCVLGGTPIGEGKESARPGSAGLPEDHDG